MSDRMAAASNLVALAVCGIFVVLALWHFHMASLPPRGSASGAVPSGADGRPLFVPSRRATVAVGVALLAFASLVAATAGAAPGVPPVLVRIASYALAAGLLARAIGEFRYVGFFKRVRGSRFATLDSLVYSPLCTLLGAGVAFVAWRSGH